MHHRRRHVTLIETLVVMILISIIGGVISISVAKALKQERFRAGVGVVINTLQLAQDLMLTIPTNVTVVIEETTPNHFSCALAFDDETCLSQMNSITNKKSSLPGISTIVFISDDPLEKKSSPPLSLPFFSSGSTMPHGTLVLTAPSKESDSIYLSGIPGSHICTEEKGTVHHVNNYDDLYPSEIFEKAAP